MFFLTKLWMRNTRGILKSGEVGSILWLRDRWVRIEDLKRPKMSIFSTVQTYRNPGWYVPVEALM